MAVQRGAGSLELGYRMHRKSWVWPLIKVTPSDSCIQFCCWLEETLWDRTLIQVSARTGVRQ